MIYRYYILSGKENAALPADGLLGSRRFATGVMHFLNVEPEVSAYGFAYYSRELTDSEQRRNDLIPYRIPEGTRPFYCVMSTFWTRGGVDTKVIGCRFAEKQPEDSTDKLTGRTNFFEWYGDLDTAERAALEFRRMRAEA